jgi:hypothetical protein
MDDDFWAPASRKKRWPLYLPLLAVLALVGVYVAL